MALVGAEADEEEIVGGGMLGLRRERSLSVLNDMALYCHYTFTCLLRT